VATIIAEDDVPAISGVIDENVNTDSMLVAQPQLASTATTIVFSKYATGLRSDAWHWMPDPVGTTTIIWTATDVNGNSSSSYSCCHGYRS
jgi:hypothetical protein